MRALLNATGSSPVQALLCALAMLLWSVGLFVGWRVPFEVTVRPAPLVHDPGPPTASGPRWLQATVTRTYPGLDGLALGDAVQFDRYGVLAPTVGSVVCVPLTGSGAVQLTPIGGRITHAGSVDVVLVAPGAPGCEPAGLEPQLSLHP